MKVRQNTPGTLILDAQPWGTGIAVILGGLLFVTVGAVTLSAGEWIGGTMFLLGGLGIGYVLFRVFVQRHQLWIDRTAGTVAIRQRSIVRYTETTLPLADLVEAVIQTAQSDGTTLRRCALRFGGQTNRVIPLMSVYTNGRGPVRDAAAINGWMAGKA
jgi:hypothetical protein